MELAQLIKLARGNVWAANYAGNVVLKYNPAGVLIGTIVVYMAICLVLGFVAYRRTSNLSDYILGGRSLGGWVTAFSAQASDMSGWLLMGLPGLAYASGFDSVWLLAGLVAGTWLNWRFVAAPLREATERFGNALTLPRMSRRADSLGTENAFVVLAEYNALVRQGKDIISFCIGQPDFPTPENVQQAAIAAIRGGKHGYTPSAGIDELRVAAAHDLGSRRGLDILPDDVVVGAGAKPFIAYTIASVTDYGVGDEVIYPVPGFPIYESQIHANGAVPVPIYLRESRGFAFDPAELEARITPNTRLLILNTPQNPTGGILDRENLDAIAEILRRHPHVWVFADEIYSRLVYDGRFDSLATRPGMLERTIISDGGQ
jgi:hypothetical protein